MSTVSQLQRALNATTPEGSKATPVDADQTVIYDSADNDVPKKLTFANLWVWIKAKLDAGLTVAGDWAFSSTTRPTSSGTGTPASNSLITRADGDTRFGGPIYDLDGSASHSEAAATTPVKTVVLPAGTYLIEFGKLVLLHTDAVSRTFSCTLNFSGGSATMQDRQIITAPNQTNAALHYNYSGSSASLTQTIVVTNASSAFGAGAMLFTARIVVTTQTTFQIFGFCSVTPTNPVSYETSGIIRKIA